MQVCIPGLHLSLGIFNRIWELMEYECQELDLRLAHTKGSTGGSTFVHYANTLQQRSHLAMELETQQGYVSLIDQMVTYLTLTLPDAETNDSLIQLREDAANTHKSIRGMVCS